VPKRIKNDSVLVRLFPELSRFEDDLERGSVLWNAEKRLLHSGRGIALLCLLLALAIPCYFHLQDYITALQLPLFYRSCLSIVSIFPILIAFRAPLLILRKHICLYLREDLVRKAIPICLHCGYDLTGCSSLICPECGTDFEP
jgi:hypothetical protein